MSNEKLYYFRTGELAVLLAIDGLKSLYGIKLDITGMDKKTVYETVFSLKKNGVLTQDGDKISITDGARHVIDGIKKATRLIVSQQRSLESPQKYIYSGDDCVVISPYGVGGDMLEIGIIEKDDVGELIYSDGLKLEQIVSDESLYNSQAVENVTLTDEATSFVTSDPLEIGDWGHATYCMRVIDLSNRRCQVQCLLMQEGAKDYILVTKPDDKNEDKGVYTSIAYDYSRKLAREILANDLQITKRRG